MLKRSQINRRQLRMSISRKRLYEEKVLRRSTVSIKKIKLLSTDLKEYTSAEGCHSVIIEEIESADIVNNLELETQLGVKPWS